MPRPELLEPSIMRDSQDVPVIDAEDVAAVRKPWQEPGVSRLALKEAENGSHVSPAGDGVNGKS